MSLSIIENFQDKKLKERIKNKDQKAFEELYDKNADDIYRFIFFKTGKKEDANDLCSLSFLKTWEYIQKNSLSNKETLRALLYKITRNVIIDHYRSSRQENVSLDDEENKIDVVDDSIDIELEISTQIDYEILSKKMMEIKNEYREIVVMRYVNELSLDEIAEITGKKKMNIRVLLHRALKALKDVMDNK
ncbi:RNA polymerase sigma factor [Patescibacteria group bacterium]|nr:RNA polymerase sigma factor [Patescibacteria group bacterium]